MAPRNEMLVYIVLALALAACHSDKPAPVAPEAQPATTASIASPSALAPAVPSASAPVASAPPVVDAAAPTAPAADKPEPISCKTDDDCWFDDDKKAIARPKKLRGKKIVPCESGGTHSPACADGACVVRAWKC